MTGLDYATDDLYEDGCPFCGTWVEVGCGCDFELVEDGSVQRKRWFHEPDCPAVGPQAREKQT